jgi:hypothetical protein
MKNTLPRANNDRKEVWHRLHPAHARRCLIQLEEMGGLLEYKIVHSNSSIEGTGCEKCASPVDTNIDNVVIVQRR